MKFSEMLKGCLNPKVMVGVLLFIGVLFIFAPKVLAIGVGPFLLVLICPLSMILMMRGMGSSDKPEKKNNPKET